MANLRRYYYLQPVTDAELRTGFTELEKADRAIITDMNAIGVMANMAVTQNGAGNNTVLVSGLGVAYDKLGQRLYVPSQQTVNVAVDSLNVSTDVGGVGNHKIVSVFIKFKRALSDLRTDGNSVDQYFVQDEFFEFVVVQGAEAASPSPPALLADGLLLADITRDHNVATIMQDHISTARREDAIVIAGSPYAVQAGTFKDAITSVLTALNQHVNGLSGGHDAVDINYAGSGNFADGSTSLAATNLEVTIDTLVSKLAATTSSASAARLLGVEALTGTATTISAGTLFAALTALKLAANIEYAGGAAWADGSTNPATSVELQLDKFITDLTSTTTNASGLRKVNCEARTNWLGGRTNAATNAFSALDKIITDLAVTTGGDDGAERIGAAAGTNLTAGSVRSQLDELDAEKGGLALLNRWQVDQQFAADIVFEAANGSPSIYYAKDSGTGSASTGEISIVGKPGKDQSGGNNNNGGAIIRYPGAPGTGGGAGTGSYGLDAVIWRTQASAIEGGQYTMFIKITGVTASTNTTALYVDISTTGDVADVEVKVVHRNSNGTGGSIHLEGTLRNVAGTATQQGSITTVHSASNNTGATAAFGIPTGTTIPITVTAGSAGGTTTDFGVFVAVTVF